MMKKFKILFSYIWRRPWLFCGSIFLTIVGTLLYSAQPYFIAEFTTLATQGNIVDLEFLSMIFLGTILFSAVFFWFASHWGNKSIVATSTTIMAEVMAKVHDLDFAYHTNKSSGKILSLINRGDDAIFIICDAFYFQFSELIVGFVFMFVSFLGLNWRYSTLVALNFVVTIIVCRYLLKLNLRRRSEYNREDDKLTASKVDNLLNYDTVKYFAQEKNELKRFKNILVSWQKSLMGYFLTFRYFDVAIDLINVLFLLAIFVLAIGDLSQGVFDTASFIFVISFALGFHWRINSFIDITRHVAKKDEDLAAYLDILKQKSLVNDPVSPQTIENFDGKIDFQHVDFHYERDEKKALKDFNLKINAGEVIALVGFSGAGKTTVVKLLQRMYDVDRGAITIDDVNVKAMTREYLRSHIGIVPQESILFNNTIAYNIGYSRPEASLEEIMAAAKLAQADEFINELPKKYQTKVGERGVKLSGGQRQRLAIARVLLKKPPIVIFDEATSSLDSKSENAIQQAFWKLVRDPQHPTTAVIIAHRLSTIMKADRIVVMRDGRIAEVGTHQQLLTNKESIYAQLWQLQSNGFIGDGETEETATK